jgi:hypothetical protein
MTRVGKVSGGQVDRALLRDDPTAPFGVRYDDGVVVSAFDAAWRDDDTVVLVEASDLVRADVEGQFSSERAREKLRDRALRDSDRLVGRLLQRVDPDRDAVIVVGPAPPEPDVALTVASVRAPGFGRGLLESSTTNRVGYVNIIDVAPTVLELLGIDVPDDMQGRAMESTSSTASLAAHESDLVRANQDSVFRDDQSGIAAGVVFGAGLLLALAAAGLVDRVARSRGFLSFGALWLLGFVAATFLAVPFHFAAHGGAAAYWTFVVGVASGVAGVAWLVGRLRGSAVDALLTALGLMVVLHVVDLFSGAHLELDAAFGYSATFDVRVGGVSGWAYAQLAAAAMLFAGLLAWRAPSREGRIVAIAVLAVSVVAIGAPFAGDDFAAALVAAIAFGLLSWRIAGRAFRPLITIAVVVAVAALAVAAQLARSDDGNALRDSARTAKQNVPLFQHSVLVGMVFVVALLLVYFWYVRPQPLRDLVVAIPTARPTMLAFVIVAALGVVLNDPGVSIPGMMAVVLESAAVHLTARRPAGGR